MRADFYEIVVARSTRHLAAAKFIKQTFSAPNKTAAQLGEKAGWVESHGIKSNERPGRHRPTTGPAACLWAQMARLVSTVASVNFERRRW